MDQLLNKKEEQNRKKGMITSVLIHTLLLAVLILPLLTYPDPPPGQEGILVNLGGDFGQGDQNAPEGEPEAAVEEVTDPVPEPESQPIEEPVEKVVKEKPKETPTPTKEVVKTEDPDAIALRKKKEEERRKKAEEERIQAEREAEAKAKAEAEAKAKAEAEAKAKALKDKLGGAFGGDTGDGKGNTGQSGNQGDKDGDPNAKNLEGISTGAGNVGGGLGSRGVVSSPRIQDSSQKTGTVVVKVCVDGNGNVTSAEYTLSGSTTSDSQLKRLAIANARNWKFSKGQDGQCGTISYRFEVQ